mmetsp:Transcript_12518/g.26380  ORF Transcript_12518/g.26380 Transcript_12518/m.26380 type:complete len:129 (-) Transcript_12518:119-505(-)
MISEDQGGHQGNGLTQALLMGDAGTRTDNQAPNPCRRKRNNSLEQSGMAQRRRLPALAPADVPMTLIAPVERISQFDIHGNNQQADDGETFGDIFPEAASPNSSLFTFQNIDPQKQSAFHSTSQLNSR